VSFYNDILTYTRLSTTHNTARWPSDFTAITNHEIQFNPGDSQTTQLALEIIDDNVVEDTEQFSVTLSTSDAKVSIGTHPTATVSILDNDRKFIT
jgi:hypothetical protein